MSQLSLEFDPSQNPEPTPQAAKVKAKGASRAKAKAPPVVETLTPEAMARRLDAHPDFRVLRRLVPVDDYGATDVASTQIRRVLILDTETTGLSHAADKIIELAMLLVSVDAERGLPVGAVESFEGFEDPGMPIPDVAKQVTGISDDMVAGQRLDDAVVEALLAKADLVVAHNAGFDRPFMEARFPAFAAKPWACSFADIDWKAAGAESAKLSALAQDRGWFYDAHRALVDCHALLQVLSTPVMDDAPTGLANLMEAADQPSYRLKATGSPFESKDKLKARGYRWDGDARVWYCNLPGDAALEAELQWLKAEVYTSGRRAQVECEALDGMSRYSGRGGQVEMRSLTDVQP